MPSKNGYRTYRSRSPMRVFLKILIITVVVLLVVAVAIFFGFKKYIVYTPEGLRLEIPWLEEVSSSPETIIED